MLSFERNNLFEQTQFREVGVVHLKLFLLFSEVFGLQERKWLLLSCLLFVRVYLMNLNLLNLLIWIPNCRECSLLSVFFMSDYSYCPFVWT